MGVPAAATVMEGQIVRQNGQGKFVKLDPKTSFDVGADQNITLELPIRVDIGGEFGGIPAGSVVASHYVFFDSIAGIQIGYVDFDAPVLGVAAFQDTMAATDFLANTDINCISTELRGLERGDIVWIDEIDPKRIWVYWAGSSPGDYIRVFTAQSAAALFM